MNKRTKNTDQPAFVWKPGHGPSQSALERMCGKFPRPKDIMGEAWFMSLDRRMYPELKGNLDSLTDLQIYEPLVEVIQGSTCFGGGREWTDWYHYLLPRLMTRVWEPTFYHPIEALFTGFMCQHPEHRGNLPYRGFEADALSTLGNYIMSPHFWPEGVLDVEGCLIKSEWPSGLHGWFQTNGLLSASLFFCLKYLPVDAIGTWWKSVMAISNPYWQAQIAVWLVGAHPILTRAIEQPKQFPEDMSFSITWDWSHALSGNYTDEENPPTLLEFLPAENTTALLQAVRPSMFDAFFNLLESAPELQQIAAETPGLRKQLLALYR